MKKLFLISVGLLVACFAQAQPVSDNATIPIGVTLNSILRLQVISGGNIEFVVSSMNDYQNGIPMGSRYDTKFNVASSVKYKVLMYSESSNLISSDVVGVGTFISLGNIGYTLTTGTLGALSDVGVTEVYTGEDNPTALTAVATTALVTRPAGDATANNFTIRWRFGTHEPGGLPAMTAGTLLSQSLLAGRYSTNVILTLVPNP